MYTVYYRIGLIRHVHPGQSIEQANHQVRQTNLGKNLRHGRMSDFTDTLTVAFVIILLFGSIVIYLYTCIQQNSQKVSLLESILLDLKLSTEIQSYTELPAEVPAEVKEEPYTPFEEESAVTCDTQEASSLEEYSSAIDNAINEVKEETATDAIQPIELNEISDVIEAVHYDTTTVSYDAMTLKELHALGKTRGIAGSSTMKKAAIIDALKADDATQTQATGSNSFLETSSPFSNDA
uniref:Rho termination factor N-terminal domain-containing protein n=1 Tax=viral metagenome TaxID=1070528 RepID=A0A6C0IJY3_9ZZZZ